MKDPSQEGGGPKAIFLVLVLLASAAAMVAMMLPQLGGHSPIRWLGLLVSVILWIVVYFVVVRLMGLLARINAQSTSDMRLNRRQLLMDAVEFLLGILLAGALMALTLFLLGILWAGA